MWVIEDVIATPAFGRLAMTERIKAPRNDGVKKSYHRDILVVGSWYLVKIQKQRCRDK
jgi:hypothetical protein